MTKLPDLTRRFWLEIEFVTLAYWLISGAPQFLPQSAVQQTINKSVARWDYFPMLAEMNGTTIQEVFYADLQARVEEKFGEQP